MWGFQLRSRHCNLSFTKDEQVTTFHPREAVQYCIVYSELFRRNNWNVTQPLLMSSQLKGWLVVARKSYVYEYQICNSGNGKNCENMIRRPKPNWTQEPSVSLGWLQHGAELRKAHVINLDFRCRLLEMKSSLHFVFVCLKMYEVCRTSEEAAEAARVAAC